ncbi:helix-turn-helix transcriptional regulator [Shinella sp.]|uniref:helix-turn-helix transcriptional regulator n=1 Tax=unclassified Shinella TaxID=2643062 RepID=UPI0028A5F83A|nr:helix-turn-helix transcriptional regulator [Shinella sp.]
MTSELQGEDGQVAAIADLAMALLEGIGRLDFQERIMNALKERVAFDASLVLLYRKGFAPKILFNDWRTDRGMSNIQQYLQGYYRMDPFYRLTLEDTIDGVHQLSQIDASFGDSDYYREFYQYSGLHDEINVLVSLDAETKFAISLARRSTRPAFTGEDLKFLRTATPLLVKAIVRHYRDLRPDSQEGEPLLQSALAQAVRNFGRSVLTGRECQVVQLILRGHSVKEAAIKLGIAPATVKLHRRNLYAKLDVTSQASLFSLFLDAVCSADNAFDDPLAGYLTRRAKLTGDILRA